jgi:hypothetical protein
LEKKKKNIDILVSLLCFLLQLTPLAKQSKTTTIAKIFYFMAIYVVAKLKYVDIASSYKVTGADPL